MEPLTHIVTSVRSKSSQSTQKLQCKLPQVDSYTLQFSVTRPVGNNLNAATITPVAIISWNLGGISYQRKISVFNGSSITGVAEHVTVQIVDETNPNEVIPVVVPPIPPFIDYEVNISVGRGVRGSVSMPPTYQQYYLNKYGNRLGLVELDQSTNFTLAIPTDAGVSSVMITSAYLGVAATPGDPENIVGQVGLLGGTPLKYYNPNLHGFVPISPQTALIVLYNNDTAQKLYYNVTFGIDG
jgi:hypothetical protein